MALYSLFRRISQPGERPRYERMSKGAYPKANAIRIFQNDLIYGLQGKPVELRPVPAGSKASVLPASENMCAYCSTHLHTQCSKGACQCNCRAITG